MVNEVAARFYGENHVFLQHSRCPQVTQTWFIYPLVSLKIRGLQKIFLVNPFSEGRMFISIKNSHDFKKQFDFRLHSLSISQSIIDPDDTFQDEHGLGKLGSFK